MPPKRAAATASTTKPPAGARATAARGGRTAAPAAARGSSHAASHQAAGTRQGTAAATAGRGGTAAAASTRGRGVGPVRGGNARGRAAPARGGKVQPQTTKQAGTKGPSKAAAGASATKAKANVWTKEDSAARILQCLVRRFLARRKLAGLRLKKQQYKDEMDGIEKEAWRQIMLREQKEAEEQRQREAEERRKRREEANRQKRMLEAAFDGDLEDIAKLFKEVESVATVEAKAKSKDGLTRDQMNSYVRNRQTKLADCEDANKNTPLSEAAAGGSTEAIQVLLKYGADPNSKGGYGRTPLYRAAFAGHLDTVKALLDCGADPRLHAEDGAKPEQIASQDAVRDVLANWDLASTETALSNLSLEREKRDKAWSELKAAETKRLTDSILDAEQEHKRWQKELKKAYQELEKRISEHDQLIAEGKSDMKDVTLQMIHDAEDHLEMMKMNAQQAQETLQKARLTAREQSQEENPEDLVGLKVVLRELDDVLIRDVGDKIKTSGKWPLIIDETKQVATFLKYRDTNYLNTMRAKDMEANSIRQALLGSLRFGKPTVMDMLDADMWDAVERSFNLVRPGLLSAVMDKSIMKESVYESLIRKEDGKAYEKTNFMRGRVQDFQFIVITRMRYPPDQVVHQMYPIRVIMQPQPV
ncbi:IQ motif and ankyrin repeat domain-containing protein 1-like [Sycon ciliatum]|uniref:IQ motif and ankyrin repeat domain-containing protein 1-like n=1 Tax=Sycon ciliatum TaxID=27933 RepID=UPI0031F67AB7